MSYSTQVAGFHAQLADAVRPLAGKRVRFAEVRKAFQEATGDELAAAWVHASDHCSNRTGDGGCWCAGTPQALFEALGDGRPRHQAYLVLTPEPGNGPGSPHK